MRKGIFVSLFLLAPLLNGFSSELKDINFFQRGEISKIDLTFDEEGIKAEKFQVTDDKQIIIDLKNVVASDKVVRAFDTSEFSGAIVFVSAYKKPNSKNDLRLTLQLRDNARSILTTNKNVISIAVENRFGVFTQQQMESNVAFSDEDSKEVQDSVKVPSSDSIDDILTNLTLSGRKRYIGKKVSFNIKDTKVEDVLKMIADSSGFNIIITDEVKNSKPLTLNLTNIPWDQALDTILELNKLVAYKNGNILMITTLEKATEAKVDELRAQSVAIREELLVTKVFPLSYAKLEEIQPTLEKYLTVGRGNVSIDKRTNSLIVRDTEKNMDKIQKVIKVLDTQTPQVLIEAKIVEVSENHSKNIGFLSDDGSNKGISFGYDPLTSGSSLAAPGGSFSFATAGPSAIGLNVSAFKRLTNLNFQLSLMETEGKGRVISSPKVVTSNNVAANISSKHTIYYPGAQDQNGAFTWQSSDAVLELKVTPHITSEGSIVMNVDVTKEEFQKSAIAGAPNDKYSRTVKTEVLVDNGSTVVIGGVFRYKKEESHAGIPFLKDVPIIGWFFRSSFNPSEEKSELVIFITPRVINQEAAGLTERQ